MSTENLEIVIDATVQGAVKAVEDFSKTVIKAEAPVFDLDKAVKDAMKRISDNIDKMADEALKDNSAVVKSFVSLEKEVKTTAAVLTKLPQAVNTTSTALAKADKSSGSATMALTNLGRVAQDLPFGFIGIANNLNPLLESFQRLKAESGSTGGALKALGGSLVGAGGLGLALSAVTAAVTFAQMGFRAWGGGAKEAAAKVKDAIGDISKSVATDLVQLQSYVGFATDVTKSYDERKKAVNALQKEYPQYLNNISDEALLTGQATDAINKSIDALLRKATLSLLKDEIASVVAESAKQILSIEKGKIAVEQAAAAEKARAENIKGQKKVFDEQAAAALATGRAISELPSAYQKLDNASQRAFANRPDEKIKEIKDQLMKLVQPLVNAAVNFEDLGGKAADGTDKAKKSVKELKDQVQKLFGESTAFAGSNIVFQAIVKYDEEQAKKDFEGIQQVVKIFREGVKIPVSLSKLGMDADIKEVVDALAKATKKIQDDAEAFRQRIAAILKDIVVDGVVSIAEGLGNALSGMKNPFGGLLSVLGNGLVSLGKMVIQTFVTLEALKKVLDSVGITNPVVGIAIGAAMVALGTVLKNKVNSTKFAEGGIVSGPMNAQIGEAGQSEVILPLSRLSGLLSNSGFSGRVEFEISGQKLLGVMSRASGSRGRTYG